MSLNSLVADIQQATLYNQNKQKLREKVQSDLLVPHGNGLFLASVELIAFLSTWNEDELYLEDQYSNPIKCNRQELLSACKQQYQKVMNTWHSQHEELQRRRKI